MAQFKETPGDVSSRENRDIEKNNRDEFDRREKREEIYNKENYDDKYSTYKGMSSSKDYEIIVHSYSNTKVGHFNVEFRSQGKRDTWLGANINEDDTFSFKGLKGGIYNEAHKSIIRINKDPANHKATVVKVSKDEYERALNFAKNKYLEKNQNYDILGTADHCVSFVDKVMKNVSGYGQKGKTLGDMAFDDTLAAKLAKGSYSNGYFSSENRKERESVISKNSTSRSPSQSLEIYAGGSAKIDLSKSSEAGEKQNSIFRRKQKYSVNGDAIIYGVGDDNINNTSKNDLLAGGAGNDTYFFYKGEGSDIIYDVQGRNSIIMMNGSYNKLWFSKERNNLRISAIDGKNSILYEDYFTNKNSLRGIYSAESKKYLSSSSIDKLTQAMANFTIPKSISDISRTIDSSQNLQMAIATNWV